MRGYVGFKERCLKLMRIFSLGDVGKAPFCKFHLNDSSSQYRATNYFEYHLNHNQTVWSLQIFIWEGLEELKVLLGAYHLVKVGMFSSNIFFGGCESFTWEGQFAAHWGVGIGGPTPPPNGFKDHTESQQLLDTTIQCLQIIRSILANIFLVHVLFMIMTFWDRNDSKNKPSYKGFGIFNIYHKIWYILI